ncbi:MAG: hypothetical protein AABW79_01830 [Nanoarchaeota archaeon]
MIKENDIVLCTVKRIEGTTVFLDIGNEAEGSMTFSEVAPGRIRNIREYIVINKKVVCKVLRINNNHIELSLRRVTGGERESLMKSFKKKLTLESMLKQVLKEKTPRVLAEIDEKFGIPEFLDLAKEKPSLISEFVSKEESEKLEKLFAEKKDKKKEIKQKITIKSSSPNGLEEIKLVLKSDAKIYYLGSSTFQIITDDFDIKKANTKMQKILAEMKDKSKSLKIDFDVK